MTEYDEALAAVEAAADWSPWAPFADVATTAPMKVGVYLFRSHGRTIYVGVAGPRDSNGRREPAGLHGRFSIYRGGRVSGFGQAIFDAALADRGFLAAREAELETGTARRAIDWVHAAYDYYEPDVRWTTMATKPEALRLEKQIIRLLRHKVAERAVGRQRAGSRLEERATRQLACPSARVPPPSRCHRSSQPDAPGRPSLGIEHAPRTGRTRSCGW